MKKHNIIQYVILVIGVISESSALAAEVNVYSYRKPMLIEPMFAAFTQESGIKVNMVHAQKGMLERLQQEGKNSPADLVFTVDIGRLTDIKKAGLTQPVSSELLNSNIPERARDTAGHWYGLTSRARFFVAAKNRVEEGELRSYEDLADPKWKGRICTRSAKHPYMVALTASMISHHGKENAEAWLRSVKANLARKPQGNDRAQVKAIKEGVCDLAVINHYYMHKMLEDDKQRPWANAVFVIFPNQDDRGTHVNISGMAMTRYAPHRENGLRLMDFLASEKAQQMYADVNGEYPIKEGIELSRNLKVWGPFKQDNLKLEKIAENRAEAIKMADRVAYDD